MIKNIAFLSLSLMFAIPLWSQDKAIIAPIKQLFDGMRAGNGNLVITAFEDGAILETYHIKDGETKIQKKTILDFAAAVNQPHEQIWNEVIWSYNVRQDGPLANVWTEYSFYFGDQFIHCGINAFQLIRRNDNWKISRFTDTRRNDNCQKLPNENSPSKLREVEINDQVWQPFKTAYAMSDAELLNSIHDDDVIRATPRSIFIGEDYMKRNRNRFQTNQNKKQEINFYFETRSSSDHHAVETGYYELHVTRDQETKIYYGFFHVILIKENEKWKIMSDWDTDIINGELINADWIKGLKKF